MRFVSLLRFAFVLGAFLGRGDNSRAYAESGSDSNRDVADKEFEDALSGLKINFNLDKTVRKSNKVKGIIGITKDNIRRDIMSSVYDGQVPRDVILECIRVIDIEVLDLLYSKETIGLIRKSRGVAYGTEIRGEYIPQFNKLVILNEFDGKHSMGLIIHECTHLYEQAHGIEYDEDSLVSCVSNLKKLGIEAAQCLDDVRKKGCDRVKDLAQHYQGRAFITSGDGIITEGGDRHDSTKPLTMAVGKLGDHEMRNDAVISFTPGLGGNVVVELDGTMKRGGNKILPASQEEESLFGMEEHLRNIPTLEVMSNIYSGAKFSSSDPLKELHAAIVERVPAPVIAEVCGDLELRPSSSTKKRGSTKSSEGKNSKGREL
ncbi:MAG: hypothetical protein KGP29_06060 [Proteobacteria bacterium]|nr:hypothetical protein [Pseudomonadota bacterium]